MKILQFLVSFSLLVMIHEFGHFLFARMFGVRVEKFYLFFNPWFSLARFKAGGTEYGIGWLPFGGYVKLAGMVDESMDTEQLKQPEQPYEFRTKPAWQRLLVMVGGVLMNIALAVYIYVGASWAWGEQYIATEDVRYGYAFNDLARGMGFEDGDKVIDVGGQRVGNSAQVFSTLLFDRAPYVTVERNGAFVRVDIPEDAMAGMLKSENFMAPRIPFLIGNVPKESGAAAAGLQPGDRLITLNGDPMQFYDQYVPAFAAHKGRTVELGLLRDSAGISRTLTLPVRVSEEGTLGVHLASADRMGFRVSTRTFTFWQSIPQGLKRTGNQIANYGKQLKLIFSPKTEAYKSLGGVIAIGNIFPGQWDWMSFWQITALLSIMLAVLNILPIPVLDGGHVLFLLIEALSGRKPGERVLVVAQNIGLALLLVLIVYANGNDIYRFFIK